MTKVTFSVFALGRDGTQQELYRNSRMCESLNDVPVGDIVSSLRFLYPKSAGVQVTIM